MKKQNRLIHCKYVKNPNKKWYEFWKETYIVEKHTLKVNKNGEVYLGKLYKTTK